MARRVECTVKHTAVLPLTYQLCLVLEVTEEESGTWQHQRLVPQRKEDLKACKEEREGTHYEFTVTCYIRYTEDGIQIAE